MVSHRQELREQRTAYIASRREEAERLTAAAAELGVRRVILFGSLASGEPGILSYLDLLIVWDTPLDYLSRTVELYRTLDPRGPVDLLIYTPEELEGMSDRPFIRTRLEQGEVLHED